MPRIIPGRMPARKSLGIEISVTNAKIINYMLPYAFPCRAKTNESVEYWLLWGKENGIKVIKWPELPEKCKHTIKNENLDKILLFPVNDQFDLKYLIK